jgi:hypothetical protein
MTIDFQGHHVRLDLLAGVPLKAVPQYSAKDQGGLEGLPSQRLQQERLLWL